jgi:hypothetical protein
MADLETRGMGRRAPAMTVQRCVADLNVLIAYFSANPPPE